MGLQSALTTALTGLQAAETTIDVVGNNVANSQTVGFKESEAVFATQFLQTISIGAAPSTNSGGTNPRQIGLGVKVAEISPNFSQGTIEISSNPLDLAIQGDGFLIVQSGTNQFYTRNGQLKLNAENEVVTTTGQRLLGYGVNDNFDIVTDNLIPLSIPLGKERVAQATSVANFSGVLNPSVDEGATPSVSESVVLGDNTIGQPPSDVGQTFDINDISEAIAPNISGTSGATTGAGVAPPAGVFQYRVAFLDGSGNEGAFSVPIVVDNTAGGPGQIDLSGIPTGSGQFTGGRQIYRTEAGGSTFYPLTTILDNVTTTYNDTTDDATLSGGTALDTTNVVPAGSYSYYFTYYDTANNIETRPTTKIGTQPIGVGGGKIHLDLTDLDTLGTFDKIRIYRNLSTDTSSFHRVDTGNVNVGDASFVDDVNDATLATGAPVNLDGPEAVVGTRLVDLVVRNGESYVENFFEAGTLSFSADKDGVDLAPKTLTITGDPLVPGGPGTTVQELIDFMRDAMGIDTESDVPSTPFPTAGNISVVNGKIVITSNLGEENAIEVPLTAFRLTPAGETASQTLPVSFSEIQAADGPGTSTEMIVYDSLGLPLKVRITTTLETKNANSTVYRWYATSPENEPLPPGISTVIGDGLLEFDGNGDLTSATQNRISVQRNVTASESPLEVELNFDQIKSLGETDAQGNPISSLNVTSQDGFPPGVLTNFIITEDGVIQGQFSNGTQRVVGQIVMARFSNNSGLTQVGDSLFDVGVNSGDPILGTPGEEGIGSLTAGAVELSNTDIGQNLIQLILASTQYRGGARVISAAQQLLDELLSLQR